jgi:hypothetical protein
MVIKRRELQGFFQRNRDEDGNSKQKVFRNDVSTHYSNELKETVSKRCYSYVYLYPYLFISRNSDANESTLTENVSITVKLFLIE